MNIRNTILLSAIALACSNVYAVGGGGNSSNDNGDFSRKISRGTPAGGAYVGKGKEVIGGVITDRTQVVGGYHGQGSLATPGMNREHAKTVQNGQRNSANHNRAPKGGGGGGGAKATKQNGKNKAANVNRAPRGGGGGGGVLDMSGRATGGRFDGFKDKNIND